MLDPRLAHEVAVGACELYRDWLAAAGEDRVDLETAPALSVPLEQHEAAAQRAQGLDPRPLTPVGTQAS